MFVIRAVPTEALTSLRVETETNSVLVHTLLPEIPCGQEPSWYLVKRTITSIIFLEMDISVYSRG